MIEAEEVHLYSRETEIIGTVQRSQLGPLPVTQLEVLRRTDGGRTLLREHIRDRRDGQHGNDMRKRKPGESPRETPRILRPSGTEEGERADLRTRFLPLELKRLVPLLDVVVRGQSLSLCRHQGAQRHFAPGNFKKFGKDLKRGMSVSTTHTHTHVRV